MITILNRSFSHGAFSAVPFNIATTTPGTTLVVAVSQAVGGSVISSITTNAGDNFPNLPYNNIPAAYNINGNELTTAIFILRNGIGGAGQMTITSSGSFNAWVYELSSGSPLVVDDSNFNDTNTGTPGTVATGPTLAGTGAQDFYVACMTVGQIVDVHAPWTLDATDIGEGTSFGFGAAYLLSSGSQTPVFDQTFNGRWSVSAVAFKESVSAPTVLSITPNVGPTTGGQNVTITGTGFVSGATVTLGGVSCTSVVFVNSTTLTAVTGAHAVGLVDLVVTNPDKGSNTLVSAYTYVQTADPNKSTFSFSPGAVLANGVAQSIGTVTLKDSNGNPVSGKNVSIVAISSSTGIGVGNSVISPASATTDSNGRALFFVNDSTVERILYKAVDHTDVFDIVQTASVSFVVATIARADGTVFSQQGAAVSSAQVYVLQNRTGIVPSVNSIADAKTTQSWSWATIFNSSSGAQQITQPILTDGFGAFAFYLVSDMFTLVIVNKNKVMQVYQDMYAGASAITSPPAVWKTEAWSKATQGPAIPGAQRFLVQQPYPNLPKSLGANYAPTPPSPLVPMFSDPNGVVPVNQPVVADSFGQSVGYAAAGFAVEAIYLNKVFQLALPDQRIGNAVSATGLYRYDGWFKNAQGLAVQGARVYVLSQPTTNVPSSINNPAPMPTPMATIFKDVNGAMPQEQSRTVKSTGEVVYQSLVTDQNGHYAFYAVAGNYTVLVYWNGTLQRQYPDQALGA